ncbi:MAG: endopeptidase La [Lentisphaeria bacterium]|nr:endopeptidase La [Lentisphaeria bacterium]
MKDDKDEQNMEFKETKEQLSFTPVNITVSGENGGGQDKADSSDDRIIDAPALILGGIVVFPHALTPLVLNDPGMISLMDAASSGDRMIALFPEVPDDDSMRGLIKGRAFDPNTSTFLLNKRRIANIGALARIVKTLKFPDGTVRVLVRGIARCRFMTVVPGRQYMVMKVHRLSDAPDTSLETAAMVRNATKQFQEVISFAPNFPEELKIAVLNMTDNSRIADVIADTLNISFAEKIVLLTSLKLQDRLHFLTILLNRELEVLRLGSEIQRQVHDAMSKQQREFFLREQLKQIREELGEDNRNPDVVAISERIEKAHLPEAAHKVVTKELERLNMVPASSPEYNISYTYIDWLLSVPWTQATEERADVHVAASVLDADHYGLKDVKERILEFLAVHQLKKNSKSPIICFIGPPGVGKTSLGRSIAVSLNRKFVRMSLGGIRDEAEIRGHRRTYIGALPGRIIQGMKRAGTVNPVFMLDELDKLGSDYKGDPASALLEVLDPEQNKAFNDHYLEVDYDLSKVMFIATANMLETIPRPLLDRMEIIRLPGYTALEKEQIAKRYLIPRQMVENGLDNSFVRFKHSAAFEIIEHYTMEAGVRSLERTIASVCRKLVRRFVEQNGGQPPEKPVVVDDKLVRELLGPRKFTSDESENIPRVGVVTGMAWTSCGGTTLEVEAVKMPGRGELKLTGSLGDVMKESALAAFSYVRGHAKALGINQKIFKENDFHIHVPDGATPKDGPSAGVTLTTAIVSLLTGKPVKPRLSMTGEITLSGKVTPIGGVREKVIAALRAGIRDVVMPADNEKDMEDVPQEVRSKISFHFVRSIDEVLKIAMPKNVKPYVPKRAEKTKDEFYEYDDYLFQKVEPEEKKPDRKADSKPAPNSGEQTSAPEPEKSADGKPAGEKPAAKPAESEAKPEAKPSAPAEAKQEPAKPVQPEAKPAPAKPAQPEAKPVPAKPAQPEAKPVPAKPAQPEAKPEDKPSAPAEDKKPESHAVPQFEFKKPTLVVNYPKFQNSSFTIGQYTLKAPEQHHLPEPPKPVPAKSFKAAEKLHLDVKITTAIEAGDGPVISLDFPAKTEQPAAAPVRRRTARKTAPKNFRPAKPLKLRVKVSPAAQDRTSAAQTKAVEPEKKKPRKTGAASAKKGK